MPKSNRNVAVIFRHSCLLVFALAKGRATFFLTRNNCCEFIASYSVFFQSDFQPYFKMPVCGFAFSYNHYFDQRLIAVLVSIVIIVPLWENCLFDWRILYQQSEKFSGQEIIPGPSSWCGNASQIELNSQILNIHNLLLFHCQVQLMSC